MKLFLILSLFISITCKSQIIAPKPYEEWKAPQPARIAPQWISQQHEIQELRKRVEDLEKLNEFNVGMSNFLRHQQQEQIDSLIKSLRPSDKAYIPDPDPFHPITLASMGITRDSLDKAWIITQPNGWTYVLSDSVFLDPMSIEDLHCVRSKKDFRKRQRKYRAANKEAQKLY